MDKDIKPNLAEIEFMTLACNRFIIIYNEIINDEFWDKDKFYRYHVIKDGFSIYSEIMNYEPLKFEIELFKSRRPPEAVQTCRDLFKFVRNVLQHFPFFTSWDDIWINKTLVNWYKCNLSIDKFLKEYQKKEQVKFRFWEQDKKRMTYLNITFPVNYTGGEKIYLKDIITEREGVKFLFVMMFQILGNIIEII
jgi:hypothetical protein